MKIQPTGKALHLSIQLKATNTSAVTMVNSLRLRDCMTVKGKGTIPSYMGITSHYKYLGFLFTVPQHNVTVVPQDARPALADGRGDEFMLLTSGFWHQLMGKLMICKWFCIS